MAQLREQLSLIETRAASPSSVRRFALACTISLTCILTRVAPDKGLFDQLLHDGIEATLRLAAARSEACPIAPA
jgi:hypothetical protein